VYVHNFGAEGHSNEDVSTLEKIPKKFDLLVGGFPCQDYSVAKSKSSASGLEGKKGVLWWEILRLVKLHKPKFLFLENVDRLLKSPAQQRGRDFAVMLSSLGAEGYSVEWRVVNAADYGFPQRRRRVFIIAYKTKEKLTAETLIKTGVLASALPVTEGKTRNTGEISSDLLEVSSLFGKHLKLSPFLNSGFFQKGKFESIEVISSYSGASKTLGDILLPLSQVPEAFHIATSSLEKWKYFKGAKSEQRVHSSGYKWNYTEGSMVFPDPIDRPSRTLLTGEGGSSPSRFKHVVSQDGVNRRLHPIEMERLNGFPDDWTRFSGAEEVSDVKRAFFMGNALVVGLIELVGKELAKRMS
jgi:DNA (cytosine-5)-methyltransferase 1